MMAFLVAVLKMNGCFSIGYIQYLLLFRRFSFHQINRYYLLGSMLVALVIPFISIEVSNDQSFNYTRIWQEPVTQSVIYEPVTWIKWESGFRVIPLVTYIYLSGVGLFLLKTIMDLIKIMLLIKTNPSRKVKWYKLIAIQGNRTFSFFHWIFIPQAGPGNQPSQLVLKHELVHARHFHSIDLLMLSVFQALCWFNPLVYFFRRSLRLLHEFEADSIVKEPSLIHYIQLMIGQHRAKSLNGIANYFSFLSIKNRINMLINKQTNNYFRLSYLMVIPMIGLMISAFSQIQVTEPYLVPVSGEHTRISSEYGNRKDPFDKVIKYHFGIDIAAPLNTPVKAAADGIVVEIADQGKEAYGKVIMIKHDDTFQTRYGQLNEFKVELGDQVKAGDIIALVGSSGRSTAPHLHYEVRKKGKPVNPMVYMKEQ